MSEAERTPVTGFAGGDAPAPAPVGQSSAGATHGRSGDDDALAPVNLEDADAFVSEEVPLDTHKTRASHDDAPGPRHAGVGSRTVSVRT